MFTYHNGWSEKSLWDHLESKMFVSIASRIDYGDMGYKHIREDGSTYEITYKWDSEVPHKMLECEIRINGELARTGVLN